MTETTHYDEETLLYCLEENFPARITEALLRLVADEIEVDDVWKVFGEVAQEAWQAWTGDGAAEDSVNYSIYSRFMDMGNFIHIVSAVTGDDVTRCYECAGWFSPEDLTETSHGDNVCDDCIARQYSACAGCDQYVMDSEICQVDGIDYCLPCRDNIADYCEQCEVWYGNDEDHDHPSWCDCEAPIVRFQFPANGDGTIGNDETLVVKLPAGTIDEVGMNLITTELAAMNHPEGHPQANYRMLTISQVRRALSEVGDTWLGEKGNFTRRLSRVIYSNHKVKIPKETLTEIGNLARRYSSDTSEWNVEFTRNLNLPPEEFAHEESCWWGSYFYSRCSLKNWGGLAIRTFEPTEPNEYATDTSWVSGRAWVQPMRKVGIGDLIPTHDTLTADAYIVFNGYGDLEGAKPARIIGHLTGKTYRKINYSADQQYVNNGGWLVSDEETCRRTDYVEIGAASHDQFDARTIKSESLQEATA